MKKLAGALLISGAIFMSSCGDNKSTEETTTSSDSSSMMSEMDTSNSMNNMNSNTDMSMDASTPAGFANTVANKGMMEVELAVLAQQKATSKDVKDFAAMLEKDHTAANNELKSIATNKTMTLPSAMTSDMQMHVTDMNAKTGADFDKAYIDMMANSHQASIDMFTQASNSMGDAELKAFAAKILPVLKKHHDKAKAIQGKLK